MEKLVLASRGTGISHVAIAGGVSANSGLREALTTYGKVEGWATYIPEFKYSTDNAAMIGLAGYYKFLEKEYCDLGAAPYARIKV